MTPKLLGGLAVTAVIVIALLVAPRSRRTTGLADEVAATLETVNTWHWRGWRMVNDKKVDWEIWGRKKPYFYREQTGTDIVLEDDTRRVQLFAADSGSKRSRGLIIRSPLVSKMTEDGTVSYRSMLHPAFWYGLFKPYKEQGPNAIFRLPATYRADKARGYQYYTVNQKTRLPVQYEQRYQTIKGPWSDEFLQAEYNVQIPAEMTQEPEGGNVQIVDVTGNAKVESVPQENTLTVNGLSIQILPVAVDAEGNVVMRVRGWLGGIPLRGLAQDEEQLGLHVNIGTGGRSAGTPEWYRDDRERTYRFVSGASTRLPAGDWIILLTPVEPLKADSPRPHHLRLALTLTPGLKLPGRSMMMADEAAHAMRFFSLVMHRKINLPDTFTTQPIVEFFPPESRAPFGNFFGFLMASERCGFFSRHAWHTNDEVSRRERLQKALFWGKRAATLVGPNPKHQVGWDYTLADLSIHLGDKKAAERYLRSALAKFAQMDALDEGQKFLKRRTERALKNLDNPDIWDTNLPEP